MKKMFFAQVIVCVLGCSAMLYSYIDTQNALTKQRILLPQLDREVKILSEENSRLSFEIQRFEDPKNLMQLMHSSAFAHLKYANQADVLVINAEPVKESEHTSMLANR